MSKRINVNPDHYKVAGRERPGDVAGHAPKAHVRDVREDEKERLRWERRTKRNKR